MGLASFNRMRKKLEVKKEKVKVQKTKGKDKQGDK